MPTGIYPHSEEQIVQATENLLIFGKNTRWKKGHTPWNKGVISKIKPNNIPFRLCENCFQSYKNTSGNQKYCKECFNIIIKCFFCKGKIEKRRTYYNYWLKKNPKSKWFCSKKCKSGWELQNRNEKRICKECKTDFICWISSKRKFCSRTCYDLWQNTKEKRECLWCGDVFKATENSAQRYCTKKCALSSTGETDIEKLMRKELERRNIKFKQYEKIGRFYVDFLINGNKTIIECDGVHWHSMPEVIERDKRKNDFLSKEYYLHRFTDKEIKKDVCKCVDSIPTLQCCWA